MSKPKIINFSGYARSGKDTSANMLKQKLEDRGYKVLHINYADYLKYIAKSYFGWDGTKSPEMRTLLQHLGTEKARSKDPDFWVDTVIRFVNVFGDDYDFVVIGDCRFSNEVLKWIYNDYDVYSVHVTRLNFDNGLTKEQKAHPSETSMDNFDFNYYIKAETLDELNNEVNKLVEWLYERGVI